VGLALVGIRVVGVAHHTRSFFVDLGAKKSLPRSHTEAPYIDRVTTLCQISVIVLRM
jgi:hypothetical protein